MTPIVLASASATRARLLAAAGVSFATCVSEVDEDAEKACTALSPAALATRLARRKALAVSAHAAGVVIGADQTLDLDGDRFDKTASLAETRIMLGRLRGRAFQLHAAVALARSGDLLWEHVQSVRLSMRSFSESFLDAYLARNADSLGASLGGFELEGEGAQLFDAIQGDYFSVLGLPLLPLLEALRRAGALAA